MKITNDNDQIWKNFFEAAVEFRDLQPWDWMDDSDIFGVQAPGSSEIGWCCIMGNAGEVFALGVYIGNEGLATYQRILDSYYGEFDMADQIAVGFEQKMLKVEFVGRDEISKVDRDAFKALGIKFRGENQWIQVREFSPGYYPWYISDEQALLLTHYLRQAVDVAQRYDIDDDLIRNSDEELLVRVATPSGDGLIWKDEYVEAPSFDEAVVREVNPFLINRCKKELQKEAAALCFSLSYIPGAIERMKGERPFFGKLAIWMAYGSGVIIGHHILHPEDEGERFDQLFFEQLHHLQIIPQQIVVDSNLAHHAIEPITNALEIELIYDPDIEEFQNMKSSLGIFKGGDFGF